MQLTQPEVTAIKAHLATIKSKRARVLEAMRLILKTITKTNGYTATVEEVTYNVKGWRDKTEDQTPVIYIIDSVTRITRHAGCVREFDWQVPIFGVYKGVDFVAFEEFIADMEECLYDNNTLCGEVNKVEIDQIVTDNQLFSELNDTGHHLFELTVLVQYTRHARISR